MKHVMTVMLVLLVSAAVMTGCALANDPVSTTTSGSSAATTPPGTTPAQTGETTAAGTTAAGPAWETIWAEEAKRRLDTESGYLLVDVRTPEEYASGHIPGAENIEYTGIVDAFEARGIPKDQTVYLYCRSGNRSSIAAAALARAGYTGIVDFGGIINWPYETVKP